MNSKLKTLALLSILPFVLTACTIQEYLQKIPVIGERFGAVTTGPVSMNAWGLWEDAEVVNSVIAKYNETKPDVSIVYEDRSVMAPVEYKERIFTRFQEDSTDISIALVHNSWIPSLSAYLAPAPAGTLDAQTYGQKFYSSAVETGVINGQVYGVPAYYDGLALVYNKAHFREIGQSQPPTAWEEFRRLALELTIRGEEDERVLVRGGAAIGTANNIDHFSDILGLMWSQASVDFPSEIDTKPAQDALTYYTNFVTEDRVWDTNMPRDIEAFVDGRVSMVFATSWQLLDIVEAMPNIEDVGVGPVPQALPSTPASWGSFWVYVVPKNAPNTAAAWDFLNFLAQEDTELFYFNEASKKRLFGPPFALKTLAGETSSQFITPILNTAPFSHTTEAAARSGNRRQTDAITEAINEVLATKTAEEALTAAKETLSQ